MLKVTQLVNGSIIYSNSVFSNSKTYILSLVLKLENKYIRVPLRGLLKHKLLGLTPRVFDSVGLW